MNLNKYTKAELISKLNNVSKEIKVSNENSKKDVSIKNKEIKTSDLIYDILNKVRNLFFSLTIITVLAKIFKNYKSVRAVLKLANYIVLAIFGISIFEAFGLGFIVKFFGELKYIYGGILAYLSDTTFAQYIKSFFSLTNQNESIRRSYNKPQETDWKHELEKAERQREWDKWYERNGYKKSHDEGIDSKLIILTILFLGGTIVVWYYGKDALDIISPIFSVSELIKRVLRGGRDDNNNSPPSPNIELDPDSRAISPDMMIYASDMVNKKNDHTIAPTPAPPTPPIPPTVDGIPEKATPAGLFDQIKLGKKLKHTETIEKNKSLKGRVFEDINVEASSSKVENEKPSLTNALSAKFDQIKKAVSGDDDDIDNDWDDNSNQKGKEVERSISPDMSTYSTNQLPKTKKEKFLDSIQYEDKKEKTYKIDTFLNPIREAFPNLSKETLEKLSTPEGFRNREEIINNLSENELNQNINVFGNFHKLIGERKNISNNHELLINEKEILNEISNIKPDDLFEEIKNFEDEDLSKYLFYKKVEHSIEALIKNSPIGTNKQIIIERLIAENPNHKDIILPIVTDSMINQLQIIEDKLSNKNVEKFRKELSKEDLRELYSLGENKSVDQIKTIRAVNLSHSNLLNSIKNKPSLKPIKENEFNESNIDNKFNDTNNLFE